MKKALKLILNIISGMIIFVIILPILVSIVLQISFVQNFVVDKASNYLSQVANTKISIGEVALDLFTSARLEDVYMEDYHGDTLIYAKTIQVEINGINFLNGKINLGETTLSQGVINLRKDSSQMMNITEVFDNFKPAKPNPNPPDFRLQAKELNIEDTRFTLKEYDVKEREYGINFQDLDMQKINFTAHNISVFNHNIWLKIENLSLEEKSGFHITKFSSEHCGVDSSGMYYADAQILTSRTDIKLDSLNVLTANQTWWDWQKFEENMIFNLKFKKSLISTSTLGYLSGVKFPSNELITLNNGRVRGSVSDLAGTFNNLEFQGNRLWANFSIKGLPQIPTTIFDLDLKRLTTSAVALDAAVERLTRSNLTPESYKIIENLGQCELKVKARGNIDSLRGNFTLAMKSAGELKGRYSLTQLQNSAPIISGDISTSQLHAGRVLGLQNMGNASFRGDYRVEVSKNNPVIIDANVDISNLFFNNYDYQDISLNGEFESKQFNGLISCNDKNLDVDVNGIFDFSQAVPQYNVDVDLIHSNLVELGINKRDSISLLSAEFIASCSGSSIDDFNGEGTIDQISYINHLDTIALEAINIHSIAQPEYKEISIESDFADIKFRGRNSFTEIGRYLTQSFKRFLPSLPEVSQIVGQDAISNISSKGRNLKSQETDFPYSDGYYQLKINVKKANNLAGIFYPSLNIASGSTMNFLFNPYLDQFNLNTKSDYISSDQFLVENFMASSHNTADSLSLYSTASVFAIKEVVLENISIISEIHDNVISLAGNFKQNNGKFSGLFNTTTSFKRLENGAGQIDINLHPTPLMLDSTRFNLANSHILLDTTGVTIKNFGIYNPNQSYAIDGKLGKLESDTIKLSLKDANIAPVTMLISDLGYEISGKADGEILSTAALNDIRMFASIDFRDIVLSGHNLGSPKLKSTIDNRAKQINFTLGNGYDNMPVTGFYNLKSNIFGADIKFEKFPMSLLDPMLQGILVGSSGEASTNLELRVKSEDVALDGDIHIKDYNTTLDYTKARYRIPEAKLEVKNSCFTLPSSPIRDMESGGGTISAQLNTTSFRDLNYRIALNFTDLLALNTTYADNSSFYGKAYGTGSVNVTGTESNTQIDVNAKSARNSSLIMPFSGASTAERSDFIRYVDSDRLKIKRNELSTRLAQFRKRRNAKKRKTENNLDIRLNVEVLPNTLAQLELDAKVGDIIKGRGEGILDIHINPTLDIFTINGPVQITEGNYLFTLQTIINKRFTIDQGGQLFWTGDPANPDINLTALYNIKTSLTPLTGSSGAGSGNTNIDCGIKLTGKMLTPDIQFTITAPSADIETQNFIRNSINTQEALSMQFLSLMLANTFMSDMGTAAIGTMGTSVAGVTGLEFLSNQLSNLISSDNLNIRFGYRPQSTTTSDEFYAGVGADLIDNVLSLEVDGNYNAMNNNASGKENPFSVDAYLTWNINKSGSLKLKGFTRTIDRFDETQGMQESGLGVYFRQEFNNFKDLQQRLKSNFAVDSTAVKSTKSKKRDKKRTEKSKKVDKQAKVGFKVE